MEVLKLKIDLQSLNSFFAFELVLEQVTK